VDDDVLVGWRCLWYESNNWDTNKKEKWERKKEL